MIPTVTPIALNAKELAHKNTSSFVQFSMAAIILYDFHDQHDTSSFGWQQCIGCSFGWQQCIGCL